MTAYQLDSAWHRARERLALLEASYDPGTIRHLGALGVRDGWRCLEVGGGGGSITRWICRQVGPNGRVVATDIDTRFLDTVDEPNLEVRRHNVVTDALEEGAFDFVHARALLQHLPEPVSVLRKMVATLKPGGSLLIEESDVDFVVPDGVVDAEAATLFRTCWSVYDRVFTDGGGDWYYGRRVFHDVCAQNLIELGAEGRTFIIRGGSQHARSLRLSAEQLRDRVIDSGLVTESDLSRYLLLHDDPAFFWTGETIVAVWGRRSLSS